MSQNNNGYYANGNGYNNNGYYTNSSNGYNNNGYCANNNGYYDNGSYNNNSGSGTGTVQTAGEGTATAALVFGILSVCLGGWLWAVLGAVFGVRYIRKGSQIRHTRAMVGIILSIVGFVLWMIIMMA